jgi:trk system potassium uptake protein TrkA
MGDDYMMSEIDAPGLFLGKSIRDLDVRARYRAQILLVRRPSHPADDGRTEVVPGPDTVIQRGDRLVVMARNPDLARLKAL